MSTPPTIIRDAIEAELQRRNRTPYWLAKKISMAPNNLYRALKAGYFTTTTADRILDALELRIVPQEGKP